MAVNDIGIITVIITFFLVLGFITPFINSEFNSNYESYEFDGLTDDEVSNVSTVNGFSILLSILSIFVWSISGIPVFLNLLLFIPRIILVLVIVRNVWIGGGS